MKKKQGPRSVSFPTEMNSVSGILKTSDLNSGIFLTEENTRENISEYSR